jgi:peptidoglycan hydrolase-like protein with peptidoglycan-binding domain
MAPPPPRRRGGCFTLLLVIAIIAGGGFLLWRDGRLDPLIAWAQPYTDKLAPITDAIRPIIAKIEALVPGHQAPVAESDDAMILETKQLLLKLDFQPGPMNGTLDPATVAAIEAYQETAGLPVDGQPSQALLDELRAVTNPPSN